MTTTIGKLFNAFLATVIALQPAILQAGEIHHTLPDTARPRVDQAYNGTDILNIATPNGAGVSHDVYDRFSAGDLIVNNSAANVDTQLGGWIEGNPNLAPGQAARLWIGEVVGGSQTQLNGILEVAGQRLDVILANEYGITCNGCGFVNTDRATLTTGKPRFSPSGALQGFDVRQGTVTVGAAGLNPQGRLGMDDTSRVDVISRAAAIYGKMRADSLNIVAGANIVDYNWSYDPQTGQVTGVTPQAGSGGAPALAVDVAALGGMYANAIQMVATERGVGVRLDGTMASSTDIAISAAGKLTLGSAGEGLKARQKVAIRAQGPLQLEGSVVSENDDLVDIRTMAALTFTGQASGGAILLESVGPAQIAASVAARQDLDIRSLGGNVVIAANAALSAGNISIDAAANAVVDGNIKAGSELTIAAGQSMATGLQSHLEAGTVSLVAAATDTHGLIKAADTLAITAGAGGASHAGTLSSQDIVLRSAASFANTGIVSAGNSLTIEAASAITNAAVLISGNDMSLYARQILNDGGVIWANDTITLAGNADLERADLIQNTGGRIEAFQGDLTIRADEVHNLGSAPTISLSQIIKWLERGSAEAIIPSEQIIKLIDPAFLGADGRILPGYEAAYAALWADVVNGGASLSPESRSILKPGVLAPSGTAIAADFATLWADMNAKANAAGTPDPAASIEAMLAPSVLDANGNILPQYSAAYASLWDILGSGATTVPDDVKAILNPAFLETTTHFDPQTGELVTTVTNRLVGSATNLWAAMTAGAGAGYDIVKILYQDRFNDDGILAELVAGGSIDIEADTVHNIYGDVSAGQDITITADEVKNQAIGATQVLLEVHKKPSCFTCHEGKVDFYDTFGGRIEANGTVSISGNLENTTVNSSQMSTQDVMDKLNAYIAEQQVEGDRELAGVPLAHLTNFELIDRRIDDYTAPVSGNGSDIRKVASTDTGSQTEVDNGPVIPLDTHQIGNNLRPVAPLIPGLTAGASGDALLAAGLNTLAETNPEFTEYANFITSNYMMAEPRLAYRDDLINNTNEAVLSALKRGETAVGQVDVDYLNKPVQVPSPDGSGMRTVYPAERPLQLQTDGALIKGGDVTITGDKVANHHGSILGQKDVSVTAGTLSGTGGTISADTGELALTALGSMTFEHTTLDGHSIDIVAGQDFTGKGVTIQSQTDASILGLTGVTLTALEHEYTLNRPGSTLSATDQLTSSIHVGGDLSIVTFGDLVLAGVDVMAEGGIGLSAAGDVILAAVESTSEFHAKAKNSSKDIETVTSHVTSLGAGGDVKVVAGGSAILVGTGIDSGGSVTLAAAQDVILAAAQDIYVYNSQTKKKGFLSKKQKTVSTTQVTNTGVTIGARGDIDIIAESGNLITAGSKFNSADGNIDLTAIEG
ncbi:filamentous hemagglutinin N-terminal domain-containing protein, partial [Neorhizobium sp. T786]|uniref:two-partner secretion domain-containing protein n=1 Tax=Pseudorhizobium xiangyangii TaxID=2883104 RepID=UPI001D0010A0